MIPSPYHRDVTSDSGTPSTQYEPITALLAHDSDPKTPRPISAAPSHNPSLLLSTYRSIRPLVIRPSITHLSAPGLLLVVLQPPISPPVLRPLQARYEIVAGHQRCVFGARGPPLFEKEQDEDYDEDEDDGACDEGDDGNCAGVFVVVAGEERGRHGVWMDGICDSGREFYWCRFDRPAFERFQ